MNCFKNKSQYLQCLEKKFRTASSKKPTLRGKQITTYEDMSTVANSDGYSLHIVKNILCDKCFEYIQAYKLDLNIHEIRMLQIAYNTVEKYWYSGLFTNTDQRAYKNKIKQWKIYAYATIGLDYNHTEKYIEVPIMPHVMQGLLRLYYQNIKMPNETIILIMGIFDGNRIPKINHAQIKEIELLCQGLHQKLQDNKIDLLNIKEEDLYVQIIEHFGQDYFITKDPNRSRWDEWKIT